jgi:hypothetical protein
MRKQFKTEKRIWTTYIYKKLYGKELPVSFVKSSEIIETMHEVMMEHLLVHHRPIELRKSIGYLELKKCVIRGPLMVSSFIKARERNTPNYRVINYQTGGKTYAIRFQFSRYGSFRLFKFKALKKHRFEFYKMIQNKDVQEF